VPRLALHPFPHSFLCLSRAFGRSGGGGGTRRLEALDMDCSNSGFDRACSHPARIVKGAKTVAYYPDMKHSAKSFARRLALPFFLPVASSYREVLAVAQLDKAGAACAEARTARLDEGFRHAAPCLSLLRLLPPPYPTIFLCQGAALKSLGGAAGRIETPAAHSVPMRRATATWRKRRARPSRVHTKSTGATLMAKATRGKAASTGARAGAGAGG
jgi:hypothetical protein